MSAENDRKKPQVAAFRRSLLLWLILGLSYALNASPPILTNASWSANQFHFTLRAETNVSYLIEASTDLRTWTPVLTNTESSTVRTIIVPAASSRGFWRARRAPLFLNAITASGTITFGGNNWIDSFDSADANYSTSGQYDPAKRKTGGDTVTTSRTNGAISLGNMQVAGVLRVGPGGTVTVAPNGGAGSLAWLSNPTYNGMIEPGYLRDDANQSLADGTLPSPFGLAAPTPALVNGTNYTYVLNSGDYRINTPINFTAAEKMLVTGNARLYVTASVSISGGAFILIGTNSNASLKVYAAGATIALAGGGVINNSGLARNFSVVGLNTCTSVTYSGNSPFVGTINAPRASVSITGTNDAVGAVIGKTVGLSGWLGLHFDENLKRSGPF
jgi:hypothetical protein